MGKRGRQGVKKGKGSERVEKRKGREKGKMKAMGKVGKESKLVGTLYTPAYTACFFFEKIFENLNTRLYCMSARPLMPCDNDFRHTFFIQYITFTTYYWAILILLMKAVLVFMPYN